VNNLLTVADAVAALLAQPGRPGESRRAHDGVHQAIITLLQQGAIEGFGPCPTCKKVIFQSAKLGNAWADALGDDEE
jgi:hypothetical protein